MENKYKFLKLLRYDIKNCLYQNRFQISGAVALFVFLVCMIGQYFQLSQAHVGIEGIYGYLIYGSQPYMISGNSQFELPVHWFLYHGYLLFLTGDYPLKDLNGYGQQIFLRVADKRTWWLEKCLWLFITCTLYNLLFIVTGIIYLGLKGNAIFLPLSDLPELLGFYSSLTWLTAACILHLFMMFCICLLQLVLSIRWHYLPAFAAILALLVISAYISLPLLPGNGMMLARTCGKQMAPENLQIGFLSATVYISILCAAGYRLIKKYEIKERK